MDKTGGPGGRDRHPRNHPRRRPLRQVHRLPRPPRLPHRRACPGARASSSPTRRRSSTPRTPAATAIATCGERSSRASSKATSSTASTACCGAWTTGSTAPTATPTASSTSLQGRRAVGGGVNISGRDFRIRPDEGVIEPETGVTQYGHCMDDWGNWFGCDNSNPMYQFVLEDRYVRRNPHFAPPRCACRCPTCRGRPRSTRRAARSSGSTSRRAANHFTSANSVTVYRDDLFGPAFVQQQLRQRAGPRPRPPRGAASRRMPHPRQPGRGRADLGVPQRRSDNWVRPTMLRTGPDGALWVCDMYRAVIEHPEWIPKDWQARLDLRAGHERGRLYRVFPVGVDAPADPPAGRARHGRPGCRARQPRRLAARHGAADARAGQRQVRRPAAGEAGAGVEEPAGPPARPLHAGRAWRAGAGPAGVAPWPTRCPGFAGMRSGSARAGSTTSPALGRGAGSSSSRTPTPPSASSSPARWESGTTRGPARRWGDLRCATPPTLTSPPPSSARSRSRNLGPLTRTVLAAESPCPEDLLGRTAEAWPAP